MIMAKKLPCLEMNRDLGREGAANDRCLESCKDMKRAWLCVAGRPHPAEPQTLTPFTGLKRKGKAQRVLDGMKWAFKNDYNIHFCIRRLVKVFWQKATIIHISCETPAPYSIFDSYSPPSLFLKPKGSLLFTKQFRPCSHFSLGMF